jgi:hypothetical protein
MRSIKPPCMILPALTLAVAVGTSAQAIPLGSSHAVATLAQPIAAKKAPGRCGQHMYWNAKERKCLDARVKSKPSNWRPF